MILLIDVGNSTTKMKIMGTDLFFSIQTSEEYLPDYYAMAMPADMQKEITGAILSSVVPKANISIIRFLNTRFNVKPYIVIFDSKTSIVYPKLIQNELGADLIASMEGASLSSDTFLVIECGTATTYSLVVNKEFIGAAIAPGINVSHKALLQAASLLHYTDLNGPYKLLNLDTAQCVRSGSLYSAAFAIDGFINAIKEQYKLYDLKVILSGGLARTVCPLLKNKVDFKDSLVFIGLEKIYNTNCV